MKILLAFCMLLATLESFSQAPKEITGAIKKLGFLEGIWKGKG